MEILVPCQTNQNESSAALMYCPEARQATLLGLDGRFLVFSFIFLCFPSTLYLYIYTLPIIITFKYVDT